MFRFLNDIFTSRSVSWRFQRNVVVFLATLGGTLGIQDLRDISPRLLTSNNFLFLSTTPSSMAQTLNSGERRNKSEIQRGSSRSQNPRGSRKKSIKNFSGKSRIAHRLRSSQDDDDSIPSFIKFFVGIILTLFLYYQLRGKKSEQSQSEETSKPPGRYAPVKPLVLNSNQEIDPATIEQSKLIKVLTKREDWKSKISSIPQSFPKMSLFKGDSYNSEIPDPFTASETLFGRDDTGQKKAMGEEISALAASSDDSASPAMANKERVRNKVRKTLDDGLFPDHLARHFEVHDKEKLIWHQTYYQGSNEGLVAITNQRVLHVYQFQLFKIFPPGMKLQIERNQHPLLGIRTIRRRRTRKDFLLIGAAPFLLWFPLGTMISMIMVAFYAGWTRDELAIGANPQRLKSYPLPPETQTQFLEVLRRAKRRIRRAPTPHASRHPA
jgi:hypothetical protein